MSPRKLKSLLLFFLLLITFLAYRPVLHNGFTNWDDDRYLLENIDIRSLAWPNIKAIFTTTVNKSYNPLTVLQFAIEYHFVKYNPFVYHLNNLLLHLSVTALIFIFALRIGLSYLAAFLAALLFGTHPMHVESVAWVTERKDVLYAFFYMLSLLSYWSYLEGKKGQYVLSLFWGLLSILSKPMALSLPLVLFICDWLKGRSFERKIFLDKICYFVYIVPVVWMTYRFHARVPGGGNIVESFLTWVWSLTFYVKKFFFPAEFIPLYQLPRPIALGHDSYVLSIILLILIIVILIRYRKNKWLMIGFLFYFVSIFFLLRFDDLKDENIVADRFMYLPSLGFCLMLGVLLERIFVRLSKSRQQVMIVGLIIVYGFLAAKTFTQSKVWENSFSLWSYVVAKNPQIPTAILNLGDTYNKMGDYDKAIGEFNRALELNDKFSLAYNNRGMAYGMKGYYDLALADFNKAIELDPQYVDAITNKGEAYRMKSQYDLAIENFDRALSIDPRFIQAYYSRSLSFGAQKKWQKALDDARKAESFGLSVDPKYILKLQESLGHE